MNHNKISTGQMHKQTLFTTSLNGRKYGNASRFRCCDLQFVLGLQIQ